VPPPGRGRFGNLAARSRIAPLRLGVAPWACKLKSAMRYRYVVRIGPEDIGRRVVVRWHRPTASGSGEDEVADVVGPLEACDDNGFAVRNQRGELVLIPRERAMAAKVIPERA
jgi:hypothetical protein